MLLFKHNDGEVKMNHFLKSISFIIFTNGLLIVQPSASFHDIFFTNDPAGTLFYTDVN